MSDLKQQLIRLGSQHPNLKPHLSEIIQTIEQRTARCKKASVGERVYLDRKQSDHFGVPYDNDDEILIVGADALLNSKGPFETYDSKHQQLLGGLGSRTLKLEGRGFGWFEIMDVS